MFGHQDNTGANDGANLDYCKLPAPKVAYVLERVRVTALGTLALSGYASNGLSWEFTLRTGMTTEQLSNFCTGDREGRGRIIVRDDHQHIFEAWVLERPLWDDLERLMTCARTVRAMLERDGTNP